jgi:hypothetical protein
VALHPAMQIVRKQILDCDERLMITFTSDAQQTGRGLSASNPDSSLARLPQMTPDDRLRRFFPAGLSAELVI